MSFYLGGFRLVGIGWLSARAVYCDFVSPLGQGNLWQLYANRTLIGATTTAGERRVVGHFLPSISPAPLSLVRIDLADQFTDFGPLLPLEYFNQYELVWTTSGSVDVDHFDIVEGDSVGGSVDTANVLATVPFTGDGTYRFQLDPFPAGGTWNLGIVAKDAAGNAATPATNSLVVHMPPPDIKPGPRSRFSVTSVAGVVTASFNY